MPKTHLKKFYQEQLVDTCQDLSLLTDPMRRNPSALGATTTVTSSSSKKMLLSPNNPLNQFAEITLATVAAAAASRAKNSTTISQKSHHHHPLHQHDMLLAQYLSQLQAGLELTPSNSPSPPPAHLSPSSLTMSTARMNNNGGMAQYISPHIDLTKKKKPPPQPQQYHNTTSHNTDTVSHMNPYGSMARSRLDLLPPPQTAPEDLRVVARKIDFPGEVVDSCSTGIAASNAVDSTTVADYDSAGDYADSLGELLPRRNSITDDGILNAHECPECGKAYSTSSNLARHRQTHRSLEDKKARKCPHCEKTYVSMPAYSMHIRTHNQGCKCPYCGKCFSRPWLLQGHIRTHTGEKPFECHVCKKSFADKSNLRAHVQTHSNTKPYVCVRCNKAFALKSYLYKHEESSCMRMGSSKGIKIRRKSSSGTTASSPSPPPYHSAGPNENSSTPPPPTLPPVSVSNSVSAQVATSAVFGQQLLLALTKARAAFEGQ